MLRSTFSTRGPGKLCHDWQQFDIRNPKAFKSHTKIDKTEIGISFPKYK